MIDDPMNYTKARRGESCNAKLTEADIKLIRGAVIERNRLREEARRLSNKALAEKFSVHFRTIEKITSYETWSHIR